MTLIVIGSIVAVMAANIPSLTLSLVFGGILSILLLTNAFYFGYLGLITNIVFCLFGIVSNYKLWFVKEDILYLSIMTYQFSIITASLFISYLVEQERKRQRELEWLSTVDGMTEVYNHRYFQQRIDQEIETACKNNSSLGLIMIDIDNFKRYNDSLGHKAGDIILKRTAEFFKSNTLQSDLVFRYGGDEFVILVPNFCKDKDIKRFEDVVVSYRELSFSVENEQPLEYLTLSMGITVYPEYARDKEELINQADSALYLAKKAGRNRVQHYRAI
ncbi:MAG: GGDEF domain-containing protein [Bacillota bacterium]